MARTDHIEATIGISYPRTKIGRSRMRSGANAVISDSGDHIGMSADEQWITPSAFVFSL